MNIATMSIKQWYLVLLEDRVIMKEGEGEGPLALRPIRPEILHPDIEWSQVWSLARTRGLGSELISFQFKMLHDLLPTQSRLSRLGMDDVNRGVCLHCRLERDDLVHSIFQCITNNGVGQALLEVIQQIVPGMVAERAVLLDFQCQLSIEESLATQCILVTGMKYIWETRMSRKVVNLFRMRAEIEAKISILRKSRYCNSAVLMENLISAWD